jgi:hypothetical protein
MEVDVIAYTTLINAHYKTKNVKRVPLFVDLECWELFMEVRKGLTQDPPDANLYALMIEICAQVAN